MYWKTIKDIKITDLRQCLSKLKKKYVVSPWVEDIVNKNKGKKYKKDKIINLYRISVKSLGFKKPTKLKKIYSKLKSKGFSPVPMEYAIYLRFIYDEQPTGEWLRIAVPFSSMIDSDGVPHLPKLGKGLGKFFIETYWSYPDAIFHPHNDFIVKK
tara:strand:- start:1064 stop:1528 length:465 start_codon:yes stop_codon:yes gene_type:complete